MHLQNLVIESFFKKSIFNLIIKQNKKIQDKFILRYGTHVVVSAKFGGEFKIMNTMRKSKATSIENFAEKCTQNSMNMFSRSWTEKMNVFLINQSSKKSKYRKNKDDKSSNKRKKDIKA